MQERKETKHLVLGGARSGKSRYAEQLAIDSGLAVTYIATAEARDGEMQQRIIHHQQRRPTNWGLVESPLDLAQTLMEHAAPQRCLLVDCLTLWLSNLIFAGQAWQDAEAGQPLRCPRFHQEMQALLTTLPDLPGKVVLVSNEVGWGIVPMHPVSRLFADEQGRLNQQIAARCQQVTLVAAGLPLVLKNTP